MVTQWHWVLILLPVELLLNLGFNEYSLTNCGKERRRMRAGGDFGVRPEAAGTIQSNGKRSRRVTRAYQPSIHLHWRKVLD